MNNKTATRQGEADDERKEGNRDRCGSRRVSGKVVERLWKGYGKMVNRNSGMAGSSGNGMERTTESRVCYGVIAWVNNNSK